MSQAKSVRVIRNRTKILGKEREFGEIIDIEDFNKISPNVRSSLVGSEIVEILGGATTQDEMVEILSQQAKKIASLEQRVEALEKAVSGDYDVIQMDTYDKQNTTNSENVQKAKKGDNVQFEHEVDGETYLLTGEVKQVRTGIARILCSDGAEYDADIKSVEVV